MATAALQKIFAGITDAQIAALGGHQGSPILQDVITGLSYDKDGAAIPISQADILKVVGATVQAGGSEATALTALLGTLGDYYGNYASRSIPGLGAPLADYKYSGGFIDFALDVTGNATLGSGAAYTGTIPADAIGLELFLQSSTTTDRLYVATKAGVLSSTGVLATNAAANDIGQRWVSGGGETIFLPFVTQGVLPSNFRYAGNVSGLRVGGRFVSSATANPYRLATIEQFSVSGANGTAQLPYGSTTSFPTGYKASQFRINGPGAVRMTIDGSTPTATFGFPIASNKTYLIDFETCGYAVTALRFYLPAGNTIVGNALNKV